MKYGKTLFNTLERLGSRLICFYIFALFKTKNYYYIYYIPENDERNNSSHRRNIEFIVKVK